MFGYDADGLLTQAAALALTRDSQNGLLTGTSIGGVSDVFTYNTFGEVIGYTASWNGSAVFSETYTCDQLGRIIGRSETAGGSTNLFVYTYDQRGQLTGVQKNGITTSYTFDPNGNRLTAGVLSGVYDVQDRLTQYGSTSYSYSANGELASKVSGASTTYYQYDVLGNLKHVALPSGSTIDCLVDGVNSEMIEIGFVKVPG